jgi:plasmid stability protein
MPTLTIKNVPDELHERLKNQAERHRRSMNSEAIWILEQVLTPSRRSADEAIARAKALNDRIGHTFDPNLIEQGKKEGRA